MPQREPVSGKAHLSLVVTVENAKGPVETEYRLRYLSPYQDAHPAWRLTKMDGEFYDVHLAPTGPECTCPDFIFARNHRDAKGCKHVAALRSVGLLRKELVHETS